MRHDHNIDNFKLMHIWGGRLDKYPSINTGGQKIPLIELPNGLETNLILKKFWSDDKLNSVRSQSLFVISVMKSNCSQVNLKLISEVKILESSVFQLQ
jgi:hypothetical protein